MASAPRTPTTPRTPKAKSAKSANHVKNDANAACWLLKSDPATYGWSSLCSEGRTVWSGVRNFEARMHLRAMAVGDEAFFYHSGEGKDVVGICRVVRAAYADPTATEGDWSAVDIEPVVALPKPVPLAVMRTHPVLSSMLLVTRSRLSVTPVTEAQWRAVLELGEVSPPAATPVKKTRKAVGSKGGGAR